ncbi:hypothetical protein BDV59DRAFT_191065 [Aspergillus ambiguus]|uniref:uncharacterized protein n=1 Tax=Aspergillus ambiguus TaxID=176160 RepID=UPI003CCD63C6
MKCTLYDNIELKVIAGCGNRPTRLVPAAFTQREPTSERLELSNKHGIGYIIWSLTVSGCQGIADKAKAEKRAHEDHRDRMGADGETPLFYDQPEYGVFWKERVELDVPFYLHPSAPMGNHFKQFYEKRRYLVGPPESFAFDVSLHVLGMITNGVFDRHPELKLIVGHSGEHMPQDFWRTNRWLRDVECSLAESRGDTIGHFSTEVVKFVADYIGPNRILFSKDSAYEKIQEGASWYDDDEEALSKALGKYHESDV